MIRSSHYAAKAHSRKRRIHPDAELEIALAARNSVPSEMSESALLRGVPAVKATMVRVNAPWTRTSPTVRHKVYDGEGNVVTRTRKTRNQRRNTSAARNDIALMATMGTIHNANEN
jgi:hypothetical protein